jgi:hypothetical protein
MQIIVVISVVACALSYAAWRIFRALKSDGDPCSCCELKKNCQKFGQSKEK